MPLATRRRTDLNVCTKAKRIEGRSISQFHTISETFKSEQKITFKMRHLTL
jgi:exosome complex RNA-binding protein Rrp42 (RNase PH superfamily)